MDSVLGRKRVVQNLRDHLVKGTWAVVAGGPKMGKTTLLQQTAAALTQTVETVFMDLMRDPPDDSARRIPGGPEPVILLLDGCQALLPDPKPFLSNIIQISIPSEKNIKAVVWSGGVPWGEWAMGHRREFGRPVRFYPLGSLPAKEARPFLKYSLPKATPPARIERYLERAGGHPYLLSQVLEEDDGRFDSFFSALWEAAGSPNERFLLTQLIQAGSWVSLEDLKDKAAGRAPKKVLDRLALLGLIYRTIVDGAAAVKIISPLLADWARRTKRIAQTM